MVLWPPWHSSSGTPSLVGCSQIHQWRPLRTQSELTPPFPVVALFLYHILILAVWLVVYYFVLYYYINFVHDVLYYINFVHHVYYSVYQRCHYCQAFLVLQARLRVWPVRLRPSHCPVLIAYSMQIIRQWEGPQAGSSGTFVPRRRAWEWAQV